MRSLRRLAAAAVMGVLFGACATHRVTPEQFRAAAEAALARADARLLQGCYACLTDARDAYAVLVGGPLDGRAANRLFSAELLIVLREKELSIDTASTFARLRAAGAHLPPDVDVERLVPMAEIVPPNRSGLPEAEYVAFVRDRLTRTTRLDADVDAVQTSSLWAPVREYLTLSLQCGDGQSLLDQSHRWHDRGPVPSDPPLLSYRRAVCAGAAGFPVLESLRASSPQLTEAAYVLARSVPVTSRSAANKTRDEAAEALRDLSDSPAVTYLVATVQQMAGNCREALRLYTATLAIRDRHENAELGRAACLTYLARPEEAIDAATRLISWRSTNLRDGYYWRAYNQRRLNRLSDAREDIERSKRLGASVENATLAGIIEYEQDDLAPASIDLERGWSLSGATHCTAAWYQGLVHVRRETWPDAAAGFDRALTCYAKSVAQDQRELEAMRLRTDVDPEFQRTQVENLTLALEEDRRQQRASALNAANCYARSDNLARVESLLAIAADEPAFADDIARLRQQFIRQSPAP